MTVDYKNAVGSKVSEDQKTKLKKLMREQNADLDAAIDDSDRVVTVDLQTAGKAKIHWKNKKGVGQKLTLDV